ncbi:MAG: sulfite exporter TauE/SafE family protein [Candidatus Pacebacteria bacterium]|nr:sulfite exporter TauE/SafE family protein [Candidatus Paceibacterota bacterium]
MPKQNLKEKQYYVSGMHCASCELLIENELLEKKNIKSVEVSQKDDSVLIEFTGKAPSVGKLNKMFEKDNYFFSNNKGEKRTTEEPYVKMGEDGEIIWNFARIGKILPSLAIVVVIFGAFLKFSDSGMAQLSVNAESSVFAFLIFGVIAGFSTCSALVGGIVLSMSKQWASLYTTKESLINKLEPHILFNVGRVVAYALFGFLLGSLGNVFQVSLDFSAILMILVSILMFVMSLQMLGVSWAQKFSFTAPKFLTRSIANEKNFSGKYMPALMGAGTVFLPCGFTITTQGLALLSGDPIKGAMIMTAFVLGTTPILFFIGLSSLMFNQKPHITRMFSQVAGFLIIAFAIFNINSALNVLGLPNFSSYFIATQNTEAGLADQKGNLQIIEMSASGLEYTPNYFQVKAGVPVEWRITDNGASGCTNAVIARDLFSGQIKLVPGQTVTKQFTATKPGKYRFSCWMGMATGIIEVVK